MCDTRRLIKLVRQNPCIWNKKHSHNQHHARRAQTWYNIARDLFDNWDELDDETQIKRVHYIKSRWRNVKDQHIKCMRYHSKGLAAKRKSYRFSDQLRFLHNDIEEIDLTNTTEDTLSPSITDEASEIYMSVPDSAPSNSDSPSAYVESALAYVNASSRSADINSPSLEQVSFTSDYTPSYTEDPDKCYLLSLLPEFKKLTSIQKWDFRRIVVDFFQSLHHSHCSLSSTTPQYTQTASSMAYSRPSTSQHQNPIRSAQQLHQDNQQMATRSALNSSSIAITLANESHYDETQCSFVVKEEYEN